MHFIYLIVYTVAYSVYLVFTAHGPLTQC